MPRPTLSLEEKEEIRSTEDDTLPALLAFATETTRGENEEVTVKRRSGTVLAFHIHPLLETDYLECRDLATPRTRRSSNNSLGIPDEMNIPRYRCLLILAATTEEDKKRLWQQPALWSQLGVLNAQDAIERCLRAGEKQRIVQRIDEISGYGSQAESLEETAGN